MSHQDPMKFKPTETEIAAERGAVARILVLHHEGKKYNEIADIELIPVGTVKSRINRARVRIMAAREKATQQQSAAA
jgi:hypothetical protein